jgi:Peptidase A4 family
VGLDGYSSPTVEQTGSESDCNGSRSVYSAWWEMYPGGSHNFSNTVKPGDKFSASVTYAGGSSYTLKISDSTEGWSHTMNKSPSSGKRSSAGVIVEAPCCTAGGGILPLADFGKVAFSNAEVDGSPLGNASPTKITMVSGSIKKDSISALSGGTSFTATWLHK